MGYGTLADVKHQTLYANLIVLSLPPPCFASRLFGLTENKEIFEEEKFMMTVEYSWI